ncbi:MAG TPA: tRNA lysidine(34) synthetase TilS [Candidatus Sulfomarinibacteraceae bacterium]|nr:tRNA lysidine(34) synthetase TilS [Candidatus Sulfomarinibacteraceae bacterium]
MLRSRLREFKQSWEREQGKPLWTPVDRLVVGVSGGPDSLALLHALAVGGFHPIERLTVGHLNHGLRESATDEARFVARTANDWGVQCEIREVDVEALAEAEGRSLEEAGRLARYRFLADLAHKAGAAAVLVGHTADDQVETVLMHLVRGTGLNGLRGMLPVSAVPDAPDVRLLRPLLTTSRDEIEAYCEAHDLRPVLDATNEELTFFRNRLRHHLLPLLCEYNPQIKERVLNMAEVIRADVALLQQLQSEAWQDVLVGQGDDWLELDLGAWRRLPLGLRRRTLRHAVWQLRASLRDISFRPVELARQVAEEGAVGAQATLPGALTLTVEYDALRIAGRDVTAPTTAPQLLELEPQPLAAPGELELANGWRLEVWNAPAGADVELKQQSSPWRAVVDADAAGALYVRGRRAGERFQPFGMEGRSARIADVMINEKIPAAHRDRWPIVANDRHLLWLVGYRIDERVRVTPETRHVLVMRCTRRAPE